VTPTVLRGFLLSNLVFNLAAVLGAAQLLVIHWVIVVALGRSGPTPLVLLPAGLLLLSANVLAVPRLTRLRHTRGPAGRAARLYADLGVATLLVGCAVAASWVGLLLLAGLLGAVGAGPVPAFELFRGGSMALVGGTAVLAAWGFTLGQARIERTHLRVEIEGLAPELEGLRVVQISDLHIGNALEGERLTLAVERGNAVQPDVLVLTGDLFDFDPAHVDDGARRLAGLRARHGVYAVLGNHDTYVGADLIAEALARHAPNIHLLRDDIVRLPVPQPLYLAGVEDPGRRWFHRGLRYPALDAVAARRPDDGPVLLLVHQPEAFVQAANLGFPLVLSGHTHGGQIALPLPGGHVNLARLMTPMTRGTYRRGGTLLYVNRGLGVGGPAMRINCDREIATLELVPGRATGRGSCSPGATPTRAAAQRM
jgi:predicted MPP superfamily phosphohydrolase